MLVNKWNYPYSRAEAVFPISYVKERKYWPTVRRINEVHGDRNLICSCASIEEYEEKNSGLG